MAEAPPDLPDRLRAALLPGARTHLGPDAEVSGLAPLSGGASRELWAFSVTAAGATREFVLRRDPAGVADPAARARELAGMAAAAAAGVPAPAPLWALGDDAGSFVMPRLPGEASPRKLLRDPRFAAARERLVGDLAAVAAAIHRTPIAGDAALPDPDGPAAEAAIAGLEAELDRIGEPHPALELGLRWLRANLPPPRRPALVHGDFRLGNVLVGEDGLTAVLDWELCHAGSPAEDLGWLCQRAWRFGNDDRAAAGLGTRDDLLAAYSAAGGGAVDREELRFWEALATARWGVICLVQAEVHLSGAQRSLERAAIGRRTCEPEWDLLAMVA